MNKLVYLLILISLISCNTNNLEEALRNPKRCVKLDLFNQGIKKLPADITKLNKLTHLYLNNNELEYFQSELLLLPKLELLNLNFNKIDSIPSDIEKLKKLKSLSLIHNNISKLPQSISKLKKLRYLNLSENPISFQEQKKIRKLLPNTEIHFEFASQLNDYKQYFERAVEFYNKNDYEATLYYCNKSLEIYPYYSQALSLRGYIKIVGGDKNGGCTDLLNAQKLGDEQAGKLYKQFCEK